MSLRKQAVKGIFWSSIQTFGSQFINFFVSVILARMLLPAEFGLIGMIGVFLSVAGSMINSGLGTSLIRTEKPDQADYSTVFVFNLVVSIGIYLIMFLIAPNIANFFKQPQLLVITRLYCIVFVINALSTVQTTRLHKNLDFKSETRASLFSTLASATVGIILAYSGFGVMSLVWMGIAGAIVNTLILWIQSKWRPSLMFDKNKFRTHFSFGSKMMLSGLLETVYNNLYIFIIGKFYSPTQLGYYNRAESLKQLPVNNFISILNRVSFPLFAEIKNDNVRLKSVYTQIIKMVMFVIAPILMTMGVLAEPIFRFLFTEKWLLAVPYFQILCINGLLLPLHSYNLNLLSIKGRSDLYLRLEVLKKILLTVIIIFSFKFGIYGLLWGQVVFSCAAFFINTYFSRKLLNYSSWEQLRDISPILLLTLTLGIVIFIFDRIIMTNTTDLIRLISSLILGISFFLTFARIFKFESQKTLFNLFSKRIKISIPFKF